MELARAKEKKIPVLILLARENWPGHLWEEDRDAFGWVKDFRKNLNQPAVFFESEKTTSSLASENLPNFRAKVGEVLISHERRLLSKAAKELNPTPAHMLEKAINCVKMGMGIPFLGGGIYEDGPLSPKSLAEALWEDDIEGMSISLATAAEYRERSLPERVNFLAHFRDLLQRQTESTPVGNVHKLILQAKKLPLIVSATCDFMLENLLIGEPSEKFVIIAHIIRSSPDAYSETGEHDGKILVVRKGEPAIICLADKLELREGERIIYKPLGSPFLHDTEGPTSGIDTVVVTERDHLTFLSRMQNQHTKIPEAIRKRLNRFSLLFLGYDLDVWQYRLVAQVFQSVGLHESKNGSTMAVRIPDSRMETCAWESLNVKLISMRPGDFAEACHGPAPMPKSSVGV